MAKGDLKTRTMKIKRNLDFKTRTETFDGEEYLVVPVVALVETVVYASNAEHPELVTAEAFSKAVSGWNGRPVFEGHPQDGESFVSGNSPRLLEEKAIGIVFNAKVKDKKLLMEAWLNIEKTKKVAPALLERIEEQDAIEVSVGVYVETDDEAGIYQGKQYEGTWVDLVQDHLALLPEGEKGACSVDAGCGIRAAKQQGEGTMSEPKNERKGVFARLMSVFRGMQAPEEMSDNDVRRKIGEALQKLDPRAWYPDAVYSDKGTFVYSVYDGSGVVCYRRNFSLDADGNVTISGDPVVVEPVLTYEEVGSGDQVVAAAENRNAEAGASCSCQNKETAPTTLSAEEKRNMTKDELKAQIDGLSDDQLATAKIDTGAPAAAAPVAPAVAETPAALAAKPADVTFESLMEKAPADVREAFQTTQRQLADKKAATIKTLKESGRCDITDERLKALSQAELDQLVKLAGITVDRAAVDYSGQGVTRPAGEPAGEIPAPPDMGDAIRAARAKDQK